mgnify:FL=1
MKLNKMIAVGAIATLALSLAAIKPSSGKEVTEPLAQYSITDKRVNSLQGRILAQYSSAKDLKTLRSTKDLKCLRSLPITLSTKTDNNGFDEREDVDKSKSNENSKENNGKIYWTTALLWLVVIAGALEVTVLRKDSSLGNKINEKTKNFRDGGLGQSFSPGDNQQGQEQATPPASDTPPTPSQNQTPPTPTNTIAEGGDNVEQQ